MKKYFSYIILCTLSAACTEFNLLPSEEVENLEEMKGVSLSMTRSGEGTVDVVELADYVGRSAFSDKDVAVFTSIKRTTNPIPQFTYSAIEFDCTVKTENGIVSTGWKRNPTKGSTGTQTDTPDRIYWTDAAREHTFIGYCVPQQGVGEDAFDWTSDTDGNYYGTIGKSTDEVIDFQSEYDSETHEETLSGNVKLCKNDILLTYSTEVTAQKAIAELLFHHGLAQVRVIVNISDFASSGGKDKLTHVSDMELKKMLTTYKWDQQSAGTIGIENDDARKNFKLWIPEPEGSHSGNADNTFTFYGLAAPTSITTDKPLDFSFNVTYPNPMNPDEMQTQEYNASISGITFSAGKCTTITISLNHKNEKMTIGAEYDDWDFVDTPDEGELKKNVTFLASTARTKNTATGYYNVTILGDPNATIDDATWLYVDTKDNKIKDVYGNDGSKEHPFQISTADQLLSFAYEVKGSGNNSRTSVRYTGLDNSSYTLDANFDFKGYYVSLDAGITLQPTEKNTKNELEGKVDKTSSDYTSAPDPLSWIGVGEIGKPFNGFFLGGVRLISRLYGKPFFMEVGPNAHIDQLILEKVIEIEGDGGFAEKNDGVICSCKVDGKVKNASASKPVGSLVGTNDGLIFACYHIGDLEVTGADVVGGLVGKNTTNGKIVASYNYGKITASGTLKNGVLGKNEAGQPSVFGCFYDKTKASNVSDVATPEENAVSSDFPSAGKSTVDMIRKSFAGEKDVVDVYYTDQLDVDAYNATLQGAAKAGDVQTPAVLYNEDTAAEHNKNLDGYVKVGDIKVPATDAVLYKDLDEYNSVNNTSLTEEEYNALSEETKIKIPAKDAEYYDETSAAEHNQNLPGYVTVGNEQTPAVFYTIETAADYNKSLDGAKKIGDIKTRARDSLNGIINSWVEANRSLINDKYGSGWADHFKSHYYVAQPASYPYVY